MIFSFTDKYRFLSNFYPSPITYKGKSYSTVEHAYQAAKTTNEEVAELIRTARTPGKAKYLGYAVTLRPDWDEAKEVVMLECLRLKFQDKVLRSMLLLTYNQELYEGNDWNDTYWGVVNGRLGCKNRLGELLMKVREEIWLETNSKKE